MARTHQLALNVLAALDRAKTQRYHLAAAAVHAMQGVGVLLGCTVELVLSTPCKVSASSSAHYCRPRSASTCAGDRSVHGRARRPGLQACGGARHVEGAARQYPRTGAQRLRWRRRRRVRPLEDPYGLHIHMLATSIERVVPPRRVLLQQEHSPAGPRRKVWVGLPRKFPGSHHGRAPSRRSPITPARTLCGTIPGSILSVALIDVLGRRRLQLAGFLLRLRIPCLHHSRRHTTTGRRPSPASWCPTTWPSSTDSVGPGTNVRHAGRALPSAASVHLPWHRRGVGFLPALTASMRRALAPQPPRTSYMLCLTRHIESG